MVMVETAHDDVDISHRHAHHMYCHATVLSGIPPQQPLFNGSICRPFRRMTHRTGRLNNVEVCIVCR